LIALYLRTSQSKYDTNLTNAAKYSATVGTYTVHQLNARVAYAEEEEEEESAMI